MAFLLVILFLAAAVGLFRPYGFISGSKRWHYGLAAFALFIAIGVTAPKTETNDLEYPQSAAVSDDSRTSEETDSEPTQTASKWTYNVQRDEMRNSETRTATVRSENTVPFDFPYGEQPADLTIRRDPESGLDVIFSLPSGQILCSSFGRSFLSVKFDDGPIRRFNCTDASDGSSEVAFFTDPRTFLSALKSADRTIIEAEFYHRGRQQYTFDTKDLDWE